MPRLYIVIVNWNGWKDTLECLESIFRNDYQNYKVVICDNASADDSIEFIKLWANGCIDVMVTQDHPLRRYSFPPVAKPINYKEYNRKDAERGGSEDSNIQLILIQTGANLGFAGGNNVGIRYAMAKNDYDYILLLNNDTVVSHQSITRTVKRLSDKKDAGMCGSTLLYYHNPNIIWAQGGATFIKWFAIPKCIGQLRPISQMIDSRTVEHKMDYVAGAAILASRSFIEKIGLMSEDYFLYCEEIDWAKRAQRQFSLAYAPASIIYHKAGATIGSGNFTKDTCYISDYYDIRNRLLFTRKYYPAYLPLVYLRQLITIINRIYNWQWDRAWMILRVASKSFFSLILKNRVTRKDY